MSIKGTTKELFIGKSEVNILDSKRKKSTIPYNELDKINYWLAEQEYGNLIFVTNENKKYIFCFDDSANEKIIRAINYIKDKSPNTPIELLAENCRPKIIRNNTTKIKHQKCKNCGKEYDSETDICPYCNYSNTDTHFKWLFIGVIATICMSIIAFTINYFAFGKPIADTLQEINRTTQGATMEQTVIEEDIRTDAFTTTLTAGHYVVGIDIPVGTYSFFSKKGTGNLYSDDGSVNVIFDYENHAGESLKEYGIENFGTEELKNIYLSDGVILTVTGTQEISAGCDDGLVSSMANRNQDDLKDLEIGYGNYGANDNIPSGTYDIIWLEGSGNIISDSANTEDTINEIMGGPDKIDTGSEYDSMMNELNEEMYIQEFHNFTIEEGDILMIPDIKVKLLPSK